MRALAVAGLKEALMSKIVAEVIVETLQSAVSSAAWLAHPGPALHDVLTHDVLTDRMELVMPPKVELSQIFGMSLYSAKAILSGRAGRA
jgi:hypothetical protein